MSEAINLRLGVLAALFIAPCAVGAVFAQSANMIGSSETVPRAGNPHRLYQSPDALAQPDMSRHLTDDHHRKALPAVRFS
jgi:hypothetical protein